MAELFSPRCSAGAQNTRFITKLLYVNPRRLRTCVAGVWGPADNYWPPRGLWRDLSPFFLYIYRGRYFLNVFVGSALADADEQSDIRSCAVFTSTRQPRPPRRTLRNFGWDEDARPDLFTFHFSLFTLHFALYSGYGSYFSIPGRARSYEK